MSRKIAGFFIYFLAFCFIFGLVFATPVVFANADDKKSEILVKFKTGEFKIFSVSEGSFSKTLENYKIRDDVLYAEPNYVYHASFTPNDVFFKEQWYLKKIKADKAWDQASDASDITIAIIDSGVFIKHFDLGSNVWVNGREIQNGIDDDKNGFIDDLYGWDFIDNVPDPAPKFKDGFTEEGVTHGTIVAGIAAAVVNNGIGIAGVAPNAKIMSLRALDDRGEGKTSNVVKAIDYAINNLADVINFSFVGFDYSQALFEAIERAYKAGIIMVAAAGNEQNDGSGYDLDKIPMYPACHDGENGENMVIGVSATDALDQKTDFSSYGFSCVDISAPGVSIFSTVPYQPDKNLGVKTFDKYYDGYWSGTSMATPIVAGAVALIEGINREINASEVKSILFDSAQNISRLNPGYLGQLGAGRLDVYEATVVAQKLLGNFYSEILLAPYSGRVSQIKRNDFKGEEKAIFEAYNVNFTGGANVAAGDVDGDGNEEIAVGAGNGGGPHIRVFDSSGNTKSQFFAYNENFRGGINVAVADIDGGVARKREEIITAPGNGGGPHIRIFDSGGNVKGQFFAYNENFRGGANVAAGDIDDDGLSEIITGAGPGGGPHVRVFEASGELIGSFYAYENDFAGGVNVGVIRIKK